MNSLDDWSSPTNPAKRWWRYLALLFAILLLLAAGAAGYLTWRLNQPVTIPLREIQITRGATLSDVVRSLETAGAPLPSRLIKGYAALMRTPPLKPGHYRLAPQLSPRQLIAALDYRQRLQIKITIPEGWTLKQMRQRVAASAGLKHETSQWNDLALIRAIDPQRNYAEGWFFPTTYWLDKGSSDLTLYRLAYRTMQTKLNAAWQQRDPTVPLTQPEALLNLASIVEKETGHAKDREKIAGVFVNRLKIGMRLQSDPTIIYGLGERFNGNLRKLHLQTDSAYNSYTRNGLPPTPIALPGEAALMAVARPAQHQALYFVAKGNGQSAFSNSLQEHNQAVRQYQLGVQK